MDVQDLRPGDPVRVYYPGHDDGPVTDFENATFLAWSSYGISVLAHNNEHLILWGAREFVADPHTQLAFVNPWDDRLPTTVPDLE